MKKFVLIIGCCVMGLIGQYITNYSSGYFEYKYYCDIQSNLNITVSLQPTTPQSKLCLYYTDILTQNIRYYKDQVSQYQGLPNSEYSAYQQSYINTITPKLLQSNVLRTYLIKAMDNFERELFTKTMIYVRYRYKSTREKLQQSIEQRSLVISDNIESGEAEALQRNLEKNNSHLRQLTILNSIVEAKNFNELMPFYTMYNAGKFE